MGNGITTTSYTVTSSNEIKNEIDIKDRRILRRITTAGTIDKLFISNTIIEAVSEVLILNYTPQQLQLQCPVCLSYYNYCTSTGAWGSSKHRLGH